MYELTSDSVIKVYLHMLNKTQSYLNQVEYSEIYLRLAFKEVYGKNYVLSCDIMQLYRKLLVLYYCEEFPSLTSVIAIMERCFNIDDIYNIIADKNNILQKYLLIKNRDT